MSNYKIYPSLIDKYQRLLDSGKDFESHFNQDADGNYKRSLDEISQEREQALLDAVNRKPHDPIEAADIGTAFNELVDWVITGTGTDWEEADVLPVEVNDKTYYFTPYLVEKVAEMVRWSAVQCYVQRDMQVRQGTATLYGYIDYATAPNMLVDLKTTSSYKAYKYEHGWQRFVYPYCFRADHYDIDMFRFLVVQLKRAPKARPCFDGSVYWEDYDIVPRQAPYFDGTVYWEDYTCVPGSDEQRLKAMVESFIDWLETNRNKITDKKIFAEI